MNPKELYTHNSYCLLLGANGSTLLTGISSMMRCNLSSCLAGASLLVSVGLLFCPNSFAQSAQVQSSSSSAIAGPTTPAKPATVEVTSNGNQLDVKVPDQAPLNTVMSAVCQHQKIKCTGTDTLAGYRGPAMSVGGTLRQVIGKLVEGTEINYEFSRNAQGEATAIAFLGHAPHGTAAVPSPTQAQQPEQHPPFPHSRPFPGPAPGQGGPPQSQVSPPNPVLPGSTPAGQADTGGSDAASASGRTSPFPVPSGNGQASPFQPFPDANGQPIPLTNTPSTALPFPDQFGNPIPVKPSSGGSPFPPQNSAPTGK
jgi:hypothetical protein